MQWVVDLYWSQRFLILLLILNGLVERLRFPLVAFFVVCLSSLVVVSVPLLRRGALE